MSYLLNIDFFIVHYGIFIETRPHNIKSEFEWEGIYA